MTSSVPFVYKLYCIFSKSLEQECIHPEVLEVALDGIGEDKYNSIMRVCRECEKYDSSNDISVEV